jgi:tRNA modification GTPase
MAFLGVIESCRRALEISSPEESPECLAVDIDEALMHMGELVGEVTTDEVLEEIFSRFCIGK